MIGAALILAVMGPSGIPDGMPEGGFFCRAFEGELEGKAFAFVHAGGGLGVLQADALLTEGWVGPYLERQSRIDPDVVNSVEFTTEVEAAQIKVTVAQTMPSDSPDEPTYAFEIEEREPATASTWTVIGAGPCNFSELPTES